MEKEIIASSPELGATIDTTHPELPTHDVGELTVTLVRNVGGSDLQDVTTPALKWMLIDVIIECSAVDAFHSALEAIGIFIVVPNDVVNEAQPVERVSPTVWNYQGVIDLYLDMREVTIIIQSEDYGDIGYLTLGKQEMMKYAESSAQLPELGQEIKHEFVMEVGMPLMWMSFAVAVGQDRTPSSSSVLLPVVNGWLGNAFWNQFQQTDDLADISNAIKCQQKAVQLTPEGHADIPCHLNNLGISFVSRFQQTGDIADISNAIKYLQQAVQLTPESHADMALQLGNLGSSFVGLFKQTDNLADISNAIKYQQKAVQLTPKGHTNMPALLSNLGGSLALCFKRTGDLADISNAIKYQQQAVQLTPESHTDMPSLLSNLGSSFASRFEQTEDLVDISDAIKHQQQSVQIVPEGHADVPLWLNNLGRSFVCRFKQTNNLPDILNAIMCQQKAVQLAPEGHIDMPKMLGNLGGSFSLCFQQTDDLSDLSNAIKYQEQAVQLTAEGNFDTPLWLNNLGRSFESRFEQTGNLADMSNAIKYQQQAVQLTPMGHADMPGFLGNLGGSLLLYYRQTGDLSELSNAIKYQEQAVQLTPEGHPEMSGHLNNLGTSFAVHFEQTHDLADISNAIKYQQQAVQLTPEGHADIPSWLNNLGSSFAYRFQLTGDLSDISNAIKYQQQAVQLTPEGHTNIPSLLGNLGALLSFHFEQTGDLADISDAIKYQEKAVQLTPEGHTGMPSLLGNLGRSLGSRFKRTGNIVDISNAIKYQQHAVQLTPEGHTNLPKLLDNLGVSFVSYFERTGNLADISNAIKYQQQGVQLMPEGHPTMPSSLNNLGSSFACRSKQTDDLADIYNAIKYKQQAVQLTLEGHPNMSAYLSNLGSSFAFCFELTGDHADILNAIKYQQQAVQLIPEGHADIPSQLNNLGSSFSSCFAQTGDPSDIYNAIKYEQQAVQLTPHGHAIMSLRLNNLGNAFLSCFKQTGHVSEISSAIKCLQQAVQLTPSGHTNMTMWLNNLGNSFSSRFEKTADKEDHFSAVLNYHHAATQISGAPTKRLQAAQNWALSCLQLKGPDVNQALEAFRVTVELLSLVAGIDQTIQKRHTSLVRTSKWIIIAASFAFHTENINTALEWLEQGRCIVWSQINKLRTPLDTLRAHHELLADRFLALSKALEALGSRQVMSGWSAETTLTEEIMIEDQVHMHVALAKEWTELIAKVRDLPNFHNFLCPPKAIDILSQVPLDGVIVVINVHPGQCDALALMHGAVEPLHIPLEKFSFEKAEKLHNHLHKHLTSNGLRMREVRASKRCDPENRGALQHILCELWVSIVWPILENLGYSSPPPCKTHIWWCATGPLAFLPIHAAGIYDQKTPSLCISDFAVSSYIPTVSTLLEKYQKSISAKPKKAQLLLLSQPNTPDLPIIPGTTKETQAVYKSMKHNNVEAVLLKEKEATIGQVIKEMNFYGWVHFACHASQDIADPLTSGFYLYDGQLKLSEIIRQQLHSPEFAFLSACQTSVGDENLSEEAVHLAAGMLAAGYQGAVATMWSIKDASAPAIAEDFYAYLLKEGRKNNGQCIDSANAAYALDHAIQQIRCMLGNTEDALLTWVPYVHFGL